jgi:tetratricopeptide (TPR) repeat protein
MFGSALVALLALTPPATAQDFDPTGRGTRPRPSPRPRPGGRPRPRPKPKPSGPKKPDVDKLIRRYTGIVMSRPHEAFPLQKLTELYRQRDGKLDALVAEFEKRAAKKGPDQFNARLALSGIYVHAGRKADAQAILEKAIADKPKQSQARLLLARLSEAKGDHATARAHYEAALGSMKKGVEKERVIRKLMVLSIELKDFKAAEKFHAILVRSAGGSLFVKKEFATELYNRGHYVRAEAEYRKMVRASAGDNRAMAPALRDLGRVLARQKKMPEALKVLKRARQLAGPQAGIRREILVLLTDVFREQGKLVELIEILEAEKGRDFQRLATIGALYEETGQVDKALSTYRSALKVNGRNIDVRVKLVHLLQTAGQLDEAIREYEALIKSAPHNADFVFELAETHIQRGERDKALKLVADLERRTAREGDILAAIADFYERIEEQGRAIKVLERLANLPQGDPQYVIDLGDRYFQQGDKERAEKTWARVRTMVRNRGRASSILGEVYLDHDMPAEALEAFREAVKIDPKRLRYKKQLAIALERTANAVRSSRYRYNEALQIWQSLLDGAGDDALLAREARTHMVSLWAILRQLSDKVAPLATRLQGKPPDLEAGRLLAEVQRRLHRLEDAEKTLRVVVAAAPGDESSLLALERILVMRRNLAGAIEVLQKLAAADPKRARQYYQRMAQYSAELYRDEDAIRYAAKAVELSPNDAQGHYNLGKMYRRRQDNDRAMVELRKAISKNDRLFRAYFDLAELLLSAGKVDDADRLYRHVVRASRDEQFVVRAAHASMQINLGKGTLESLERELLPVALGNPQKTVYRRLLVELYGRMTFPLVNQARLGNAAASKTARAKLSRIGARAVKPLLDALADAKHDQQRVAIEVLAYVENKGAGPALFNYARSQAGRELRVRAMVAVGALRDPALLDRYRELLLPSDAGTLAPGDAVAVAAAWGVARLGDKRAEPLLRKLIDSGSPDIRALAALGLGLSGNAKHAEVLGSLARSPEAGPMPRAAAAHALGELGLASNKPLLLALTDASQQDVRTAAMLALSRLEAKGRTPFAALEDANVGELLARALLGEEAELRRTAMAATTAIASASHRRSTSTLQVPDGVVSMREVLRGLAPSGYDKSERARALVVMLPHLQKEALAAVATSPERARIVAELTMTDLAPLLEEGDGELPKAQKQALANGAEAIAAASVPGFAALARHPSESVRKRSIEFLARRTEPEAIEAVVAALDPSDAGVCKAALSAVGDARNAATVSAIIALTKSSESWSLRAHAARALGRVARQGEQRAAVEATLTQAAQKDSFALVREAAIRAIAVRGGDFSGKLLRAIAKAEKEPGLRALAAGFLEAKP